MTYIDHFLTPVPRSNRAAYEELARISSEVTREHGALRVVECWLDEAGANAATYHADTARQSAESYRPLAAAAGVKNGETLVVSWVEWPDKQARDDGMAKVMADPRMQFNDQVPVFDGLRLLAAGFIPMLDDSANV